MNKQIKNKIYTTLDHLYDELDNCKCIKDNLDYETEFGELVCNETRIKLFKDFIILFKMFRKKSNGNEKENSLKLLNKISNRIKLHMSQLKRIEYNKHILEDNRLYFTSLLQVAYSLIFYLN